MATKVRLCAPLHPYSSHASEMDWLDGSTAPFTISCPSSSLAECLQSVTIVRKSQWSSRRAFRDC